MSLAENWRGAWVVAYRELLRYFSERSRIISSLGFPLVFLVVFGAGFGRIIGSLAPGVDFVTFMYPGIVAMSVLTSSFFGGVSVIWDREFGFMREILVAPIGRTGVVIGKAAGASFTALLQVSLMVALAPLLGVQLSLGIVLALVPVVIILSLALSGLGIMMAAAMRSQQGYQLLTQLLMFPLIFLAGVFYPVNEVPLWLEVVSKVNPLTYGVDAIRQVFLGSVPGLGVTVLGHTMSLIEEVAVIAGLGVVLLGGAVVAFNRQE